MASRKRRILLRVGAVLLLLLLLLVALPLWFPWLLRPLAKPLGLHYDHYERDGYGRFRLTGVTAQTAAGTFTARQAEGFMPTAWLWKVTTGGDMKKPFLDINSWEFTSHPKTNTRAATSPSVYTNVNQLERTFVTLQKWVPLVVLTNGSVRLPGAVVLVPSAVWSNGTLTAATVLPGKRNVSFKIDTATAAPWQVTVSSPDLDLSAQLVLSRAATVVSLDGTLIWQTNRLEVSAAFSKSGLLPERASLRAPAFEIPAGLIRLQEYRALTGSMEAAWNTNHFVVDVSASAAPESSVVPPIQIALHASGDTNRVRIDTARITAPWLQASLSQGMELQRAPPFLSEPARLEVAADLEGQPWLAATGSLRGTAMVFPSGNRFPRITFSLLGSNVAVTNFDTRSLRVEGEFDWPVVAFAPARVEMADGSEARLTGVYSIPTRSITQGEMDYAGSYGRQFLPKGYRYQSATIHARFSGSISNLVHTGTAELEGASISGSKPMHLTLGWKGSGYDVESASLQASAGASRLELGATVDVNATGGEATVSSLTVQAETNAALVLAQPFHVQFRKSTDAPGTNHWRFELQPVHWVGTNQELQLEAAVDWPKQGTFRAMARGFRSEMFRDFVKMPDGTIGLNELDLAGGWTNGPIGFALRSSAWLESRGVVFAAQAEIDGGDAISIRQLAVSSRTQDVLRVQGTLPVKLQAGGEWVGVDPAGAVRLEATTDENSPFWDEFARMTGVRLLHPALTARVAGTWRAPQGTIRANVAQVQFPSTTNKLPSVEDLRLLVELNLDTVRIQDFRALVEGQLVQLDAELPLGQGIWTRMLQKREWPDWKTGTARLRMDNARIASFASLTPTLIAPQGRADLNLTLEKGGNLQGKFGLHGAATRPIESIGAIHDIEAEAVFTNRVLELQRLAGSVGGQPIQVDGRAEFSDPVLKERALPAFELHLRGTNVPLARKPDVVVRADLDLAITNGLRTNGIISGTVRLRDSFFLSDLKSLVPGGVASPKRRPPYFSVEVEPWAAWRLDVKVQGERFLKVQGPLFRGTISTTMRVEGPLRNPLALGEVRINSGAITFPFGSLDVQQGFVSLTSDDPYHPRLFVNAAAERLGYDIKLEVTGPADQPVMQFSSTPPLSSEQILLMLTAGQMPQGLAATTTQQRAQGLALFVGKNLLSELGIGGGGEGRLSIRSGEHLTETGRPTYEVEYKLNDDWSVIGEYDRFSQYNLGVKWRVYSR